MFKKCIYNRFKKLFNLYDTADMVSFGNFLLEIDGKTAVWHSDFCNWQEKQKEKIKI